MSIKTSFAFLKLTVQQKLYHPNLSFPFQILHHQKLYILEGFNFSIFNWWLKIVVLIYFACIHYFNLLTRFCSPIRRLHKTKSCRKLIWVDFDNLLWEEIAVVIVWIINIYLSVKKALWWVNFFVSFGFHRHNLLQDTLNH